MAQTRFSGPVVSDNGFVGAFTGGTTSLALTGTLSVDGASTLTGAVDAPAGVTGDLTGNVTGNLTGDVTGNVTGDLTGTPTLVAYTLLTLPAVVVGALIYVSDANSGDGTVCFGKGTDWVDIKTGSAVA